MRLCATSLNNTALAIMLGQNNKKILQLFQQNSQSTTTLKAAINDVIHTLLTTMPAFTTCAKIWNCRDKMCIWHLCSTRYIAAGTDIALSQIVNTEPKSCAVFTRRHTRLLLSTDHYCNVALTQSLVADVVQSARELCESLLQWLGHSARH